MAFVMVVAFIVEVITADFIDVHSQQKIMAQTTAFLFLFLSILLGALSLYLIKQIREMRKIF